MTAMFLADCPSCGLRELRGPRSIELLVNAAPDAPAAGPTLVYRCRGCRALTELRSGRPLPLPARRTAA